jgi:hypothetical protein
VGMPQVPEREAGVLRRFGQGRSGPNESPPFLRSRLRKPERWCKSRDRVAQFPGREVRPEPSAERAQSSTPQGLRPDRGSIAKASIMARYSFTSQLRSPQTASSPSIAGPIGVEAEVDPMASRAPGGRGASGSVRHGGSPSPGRRRQSGARAGESAGPPVGVMAMQPARAGAA